jgi:hypothetical protein
MMTGFTVALVALNALFAEGGRLHHLILAYPMLQAGTGVALSRWRSTRVLAAVLILGTGVSTAVNLEWYSRKIGETGGSSHWSDAIYKLADWMRERPGEIYVATAWGFYRPLHFLTGGRVTIQDRYFEILPDPIAPENVEDLRRSLGRRNALWLTSEFELMYRANWTKLQALASDMGLTPRLVRTFETRLGQPAYRVMSFHPDPDTPLRPAAGAVEDPNSVLAPLPAGTLDVGFQLTLARPDRAAAMTVELLDSRGERLRAFWRAADWNRFPWPAQPLMFGPGLFPEYFTPLAGARDGAASAIRITVEGRRGAAVGVQARGFTVRTTPADAAQR